MAYTTCLPEVGTVHETEFQYHNHNIKQFKELNKEFPAELIKPTFLLQRFSVLQILLMSSSQHKLITK
jgi:hypothetical protein